MVRDTTRLRTVSWTGLRCEISSTVLRESDKSIGVSPKSCSFQTSTFQQGALHYTKLGVFAIPQECQVWPTQTTHTHTHSHGDNTTGAWLHKWKTRNRQFLTPYWAGSTNVWGNSKCWKRQADEDRHPNGVLVLSFAGCCRKRCKHVDAYARRAALDMSRNSTCGQTVSIKRYTITGRLV